MRWLSSDRGPSKDRSNVAAHVRGGMELRWAPIPETGEVSAGVTPEKGSCQTPSGCAAWQRKLARTMSSACREPALLRL